jgi:hypothetical protein
MLKIAVLLAKWRLSIIPFTDTKWAYIYKITNGLFGFIARKIDFVEEKKTVFAGACNSY